MARLIEIARINKHFGRFFPYEDRLMRISLMRSFGGLMCRIFKMMSARHRMAARRANTIAPIVGIFSANSPLILAGGADF